MLGHLLMNWTLPFLASPYSRRISKTKLSSTICCPLKYEAEIVDLDGPLPEVCPDPFGGPFNASGMAGVLLANGAPAICGGRQGDGDPR